MTTLETTSPKQSPPTLPPTQNLNVVGTRAIVTPRQLEREMPLSTGAHQTVIEGRQTIRQILRGEDKRLLVVLGPCSVHDVEAAAEYAGKLAGIRQSVSEKLYIVMRVYFEKPRTTVGWKGLINDPHLDGTFDMNTGLRLARQLLLNVNALGLPSATELLDPVVPQYIDDLISWAAIGARTTESQTHRQMASGLSMPVGYKNSTDGSIQIAIDAFKAARSPHHFLGIDENGVNCIVQTRGNSDGHIILRGGQNQTNYDPATVAAAAQRLTSAGLPARLMVDCSHANSSKKHENQAAVWESVIEQRRNPDCPIVGIMVESNLHEGRQEVPTDLKQIKYGVSITDACIGWEMTERLLATGAEKL